VLNYSWKASPNRWGRPEFNASFSTGFWNWLIAIGCEALYVMNPSMCPSLPNHLGTEFASQPTVTPVSGRIRFAGGGVLRAVACSSYHPVAVKCAVEIHQSRKAAEPIECDSNEACLWMMFVSVSTSMYHQYVLELPELCIL
jgi:hypothetical protein